MTVDDIRAVILAGGRGTRLRPLTDRRPKPLLLILEKPCIEYIINSLYSAGIEKITVACGYRSADLIEHLKEFHSGLGLDFAIEDRPAGTAGAVKLLEDRLKGTFLVASGDVLADVDIDKLVRFHRQKEALATMALTEVERPEEFGIVGLDGEGRIRRFKEKPAPEEVFSNLINAGIYVLERKVLDYIPLGRMFDFSKDLFPELLKRGEPIYGIRLDGMWKDIGRPSDLIDANLLMVERITGKKGAGNAVFLTPPPQGVRILKPIYVGERCRLSPDSCLSAAVIESDVEIGKTSTISRSLIMRGSRIGAGSSIENTVIGEGCVIPPMTILKDCVIADGTVMKSR